MVYMESLCKTIAKCVHAAIVNRGVSFKYQPRDAAKIGGTVHFLVHSDSVVMSVGMFH